MGDEIGWGTKMNDEMRSRLQEIAIANSFLRVLSEARASFYEVRACGCESPSTDTELQVSFHRSGVRSVFPQTRS